MQVRARAKSSILAAAVATVAILISTAPMARASFALGSAANYAVLFEGGGSAKQYQMTSDSGITGNVGIGGTGTVGLAGGTITGNLDFANTGNCPPGMCGGTVTGTITSNVSAVTSALTTVNDLSSTLGGLTLPSYANIAIDTTGSGGQTITLDPGVNCYDDGSGDCVFNVTSFATTTGATHFLTVDGTGAGTLNAVFNFGSSFGSGAVQVQSGINIGDGLTDDSVLWNITNGSGLTGGNTLQGPNNNVPVNGIFLDPNGTINLNSITIDGRVFGGDSSNMSIVSNAYVDAPSTPPPPVPEPASFLLLGTVLAITGKFFRWRVGS